MLKGQKKHIDKEQGKTKHEAPLFIFFKTGIKIAGSDLQSRVGRISGNTGPETEFSLDPPLPVVVPFFH